MAFVVEGSCYQYLNEGTFSPVGKTADGRWYYHMEYTWDVNFYLFYESGCSGGARWQFSEVGPPSTTAEENLLEYAMGEGQDCNTYAHKEIELFTDSMEAPYGNGTWLPIVVLFGTL